MASYNYCPELTGALGQKLLTVIQKELQKVATTNKQPFQKEMTALVDTIKIFAQNSSPSNVHQLSCYVKTLQKLHPYAFSASDSGKDLLIHVLELLEFNNFESSCLKGEKITMSKAELLSEIESRLLTNLI